LRGVITTLVSPFFVSKHLLASDGADVADLSIADAELGGVVQDGMDM